MSRLLIRATIQLNNVSKKKERGKGNLNINFGNIKYYLTKWTEGMGSFGCWASPLFPTIRFGHSEHFRWRISWRIGREKCLTVFDEDLNDFVAELDVHDGGYRLLTRPQQSWTEADANVGGCHLWKKYYFINSSCWNYYVFTITQNFEFE